MTYNYKIGNLEFNKVVNDEHPYERATAPFRKEQFDAAAVVGDQSLTGWWTRGQFSFHEGAGVKYYEVLDGEDALFRFQDSHHVHPWKPGEVKLAPGIQGKSTYPANTGNPLNRAVVATQSGTASITFPDGKCYENAIEVLPTVAGTFLSLCASEGVPGGEQRIWAGVDNRIEMWEFGNAAGISVVWTNNHYGAPTGDRIEDIFYAKDRLWVRNTANDWYMLPTTGGTIPVGGGSYVFWPDAGGSKLWSFTDTPGAIYIGRNSLIYKVTLDTSVDPPVVGTPVVAADLGTGTLIQSLAYCRGVLGILTETAFIPAVIRDDGSLALGPEQLTFHESNCRGMSTKGDRIFFTAYVDEGDTLASVYEVNTSGGDDPLHPTWMIRARNLVSEKTATSGNFYSWCARPPDSDDPRLDVVVVGSCGGPDGINTFTSSTLQPQGYVLTGYHRLGTLENKKFYSIEVTAETATADAGQKIEVAWVDAAGVETVLGSAGNGKTRFQLDSLDATEAIAFKFTLKQGTVYAGDYSPILLGYQLKALPMPQRQRLIRVPLMMYDTERGPTGRARGAEKSAWTRYKALEALEEFNALVTFEDSDTGETGQAYIESVELIQRNGSKGRSRSNGFGGVVSVTLRKVA